MVAVGQEQPLFGIEDDYRREGVDHLGVVLRQRGVEVRLRIDLRVGEQIGYTQLRHHCALIVAVNLSRFVMPDTIDTLAMGPAFRS